MTVLLLCAAALAQGLSQTAHPQDGVFVAPSEAVRAAFAAERLTAPAEPRGLRITINRDAALTTTYEPTTGARLELRRYAGDGDIVVSGDVDTRATLPNGGGSLHGVSLLGGGVNVGVEPTRRHQGPGRGRGEPEFPASPATYTVGGVYKKADGSNGSFGMTIEASGDGFRITGRRLDMTARRTAWGYTVEGEADAQLYARREIAVLSAVFAALTLDAPR